MTQIRAAVEALRTSREALGRPDGADPWFARDGVIRVSGTVPDALVDGEPVDYDWPVTRDAGPVILPQSLAAHLALVASPHVVQALEELLAAEDDCREADAAIAAIPQRVEVEDIAPIAAAAARAELRRDAAFDALSAAITRRTP